MTLRIGLLGAGRMGEIYARHLGVGIPEVDLVAIAALEMDRVNELAKRYGAKFTYNNHRELFARDDIDAVVIATSTGTHVEMIKAAAQAGKHIFCEKPLAMTLAGCDEAIAAADKAKVKLYMGFMRHFDAACQAAKKQIDDGVIGQPVMFKSVGRDPKRTSLEFAKRENGGGMILDMGVHDFDLARWLMGSEVERVYSEGGCLAYPELKEVGDIDNAVVNFKFANGAIGNLDLSRNAVYGYDVRTEVIGTKGAVMIGYLQYTPTLTLVPNNISHDTVPYFMERFSPAYASEIEDFVRCVIENRPPTISGRDARAATAIGIAATRSLDEQRPVLVSEVG